MTRRTRLAFTGLVALLVVVIMAAVIGGLFLFRTAEQYYRDSNAIRLDPLGLSAFTDIPTPLPGNRRVVFYGDSRAARWPAPIVDGFTFINRGMEGQTSAQVAGRFDAHIRPLQPNILLVQMCVNDLKTIPLFPERQDEIIADCLTHTRQVVAQARDMGATVIVTTVFPVGVPSLERRLFFWSVDIAKAVDTVNAALHDLAGEGVYVLDTYTILADDSGLTRPAYAADTLHLNPAGYAALNVALVELLKSCP
ncbi:MAG: SGNH/GDSL hydrolase family protein [Anaerolineaceae bacterium]|nr:SGNH/GDSL hydrolase family protein [Anaerolineaceae bacterium]